MAAHCSGLVIPQLLRAPFTAPRGDNDGLWILIFPMLIFGLSALYLFVYLVALATRSLRNSKTFLHARMKGVIDAHWPGPTQCPICDDGARELGCPGQGPQD